MDMVYLLITVGSVVLPHPVRRRRIRPSIESWKLNCGGNAGSFARSLAHWEPIQSTLCFLNLTLALPLYAPSDCRPSLVLPL